MRRADFTFLKHLDAPAIAGLLNELDPASHSEGYSAAPEGEDPPPNTTHFISDVGARNFASKWLAEEWDNLDSSDQRRLALLCHLDSTYTLDDLVLTLPLVPIIVCPTQVRHGTSPTQILSDIEHLLAYCTEHRLDISHHLSKPMWELPVADRKDTYALFERVVKGHFYPATVPDGLAQREAMKVPHDNEKAVAYQRLVNLWYHLLNPDPAAAYHAMLQEAWLTGALPKEQRNPLPSNSGEYLVLADEEADTLWDEQLESYAEDCLEIPENIRPYFDMEKWKEDARHDGRGHSLSFYNGEEHEALDYFIFRQG